MFMPSLKPGYIHNGSSHTECVPNVLLWNFASDFMRHYKPGFLSPASADELQELTSADSFVSAMPLSPCSC